MLGTYYTLFLTFTSALPFVAESPMELFRDTDARSTELGSSKGQALILPSFFFFGRDLIYFLVWGFVHVCLYFSFLFK